MRRMMCLIISAIPALGVSATCQELMNQLPLTFGESTFSEPIDKFVENCKQRPTSDTPEALQECIKTGLRSMGVSGNYVAQIKMAQMECQAGNDAISKNWLGMILNNNHASEELKAVARKAVEQP